MAKITKLFLLLAIASVSATVTNSTPANAVMSHCYTTAVYDDSGSYLACTVYLNGETNSWSPAALTEAGCKTFCAALDRTAGTEKQISTKPLSNHAQ